MMPAVRKVRRGSDEEEEADEEPRTRKSTRGSSGGGRRSSSSRHGGSSRSRSRVDSEDEEYEDEDEEEEYPRSKTKSRSKATSSDGKGARPKISGGWETFHRNRDRAPSDFPKTLKITEDEKLIKFMDEKPFASLWSHWIERKGKRSFVCFNQDQEKGGGDCPLCHQGDVPSMHNYFNVIDFEEPDDPQVRMYDASRTVTEWLEKKSSSKSFGPLNREDVYYEIQMVNGRHQLNPVKEEEIEDDWEEVLPDGILTDEELDDFDKEAFGEDDVQVTTLAEVKKVAKELDRVRE